MNEQDLPVNPPGAYFREGFDVMMTENDLYNWEGDGGPEYQPRIRIHLQEKIPGLGAAVDDEATEIDDELDWYDCD